MSSGGEICEVAITEPDPRLLTVFGAACGLVRGGCATASAPHGLLGSS
ncbi:hypothetical protein [Streptomyces ureilyticus]|uniref:Uncharacterized protein n=1 Tax=Streptomyces ureilyticus TaxID=1775131 RepID=A0ABX0E1B1_9ACTN|nr:hypothetical protein [Streptomyces ureilyticus]NGO47553.1 hypothetical protein [Streptomyces ureilyticus]